jgi:hypothetical protein
LILLRFFLLRIRNALQHAKKAHRPPPVLRAIHQRLTFSALPAPGRPPYTPSITIFALFSLPPPTANLSARWLPLIPIKTLDHLNREVTTVVFRNSAISQLKRLTSTDNYYDFSTRLLPFLLPRSIESIAISCDYNLNIIPPFEGLRLDLPYAILRIAPFAITPQDEWGNGQREESWCHARDEHGQYTW